MAAEQAKVIQSVNDISIIWITLKVEDRQVLFVALAADGMINRLGTGAADNRENDMYIGKTRQPLFQQLRSQVKMEWLKRSGAYTVPEGQGQQCDLTLGFGIDQQRGTGLRFLYRSDSMGPPMDIKQFVREAVKLTDPWYEEQKTKSGGA